MLATRETICYKNETYSLVAGYTDKLADVKYYFSNTNNILLHVNSRHNIVFLEQPIDFPGHFTTEREKTAYITSRTGMARNEPSSLDEVLVYADDNFRFYLYNDNTLIQYVLFAGIIDTRVDSYEIEEYETDYPQDVFNRARTLARIILAHMKQNKTKRKNFPVLA